MASLQDVQQALSRHREALEARNPDLYRDLALYLQVLRDGLLNSVQQACFHLATRLLPDRYCALSAAQRAELQQVLIDRVQQAGHLITVEQVALLAGEMARERLERRRSRQREWLAQLRKLSEESGADAAEADSADGDGPSAPTGPVDGAAGPLERSIDLDLAPPLQPELWGGGRVLPLARLELGALGPAGSAAQEPAAGLQPPDGMDPFGSDTTAYRDDEEPDDDPAAEGPGTGSGDAAERAAAAFAALLEGDLPSDGDGLLAALLEPPVPGDQPPPAPWDQPALPLDPLLLLVWLDGFDRALERRLRNLSHALNTDLLRIGLCQSLLPLNLLEGALRGQLEQLQAPANLLRLQLPLASEGAARLDAAALLLRVADLEQDLPALRQCRSRLRQQRLEVRRMADQHRRLQRRLQTLEAERLWLQDIPRAPQDPHQPPPAPPTV